ncbi:MAG: uncharacterized protein JWR66_1722 [Modestobacter sp.]|nr:uncharacterized protein [Modestobacter sp.]
MAEQRRRATGTRPAAQRRAPARRSSRTRSRPRAGWLAPLIAVAAGALVAGSQLTPVLLQMTASTEPVADQPAGTAATTPRPTAAPTPPLAEAQGVNTLDDVAASAASRASVATQGGLAIPQPPRPQQIVIMPNAAVGTPPSYKQRPDACGGGGTTPRRMVPGIVPGAGTATLDWMSDNRPEVLGYRVQAVSQRLVGGQQPAPVMQTVGQPTGCVPVSVTLTGLASGVPYVFWLEEQVTSSSTGVTRLVQVGTSEAVVIG